MTSENWLRSIGKTTSDNSTTILSGLAVAGVVATVALAVRATPKAIEKIRVLKWQDVDKETVAQNETPNEPPLIDIIKVTWQDYLPAAATGVATIACIVGANQLGMRRTAAVMGAYSLVDTAFREYKDEVIAQIGKNKEAKVGDAVRAKQIEENPPKDNQIIITGGGDQLCYESLTGRYFKSDVELLRRAENEINRRIVKDMYASQNEFYELIGLGSVTIGEELGWNIETHIELIYSSHLAQDGSPCLALGYSKFPIRDYSRLG